MYLDGRSTPSRAASEASSHCARSGTARICRGLRLEGACGRIGDEDKAIAAFKRAISEGRGFQPEAYTGLGILYKDRAESFAGSADYDQETASYQEAAKYLAVAAKQLGSAPDAMVVYQLLGLIYERQKKFKEAIAVYEHFLGLFPKPAKRGRPVLHCSNKKQRPSPKSSAEST